MRVIEVGNVCQALPTGILYLEEHGQWQNSRNGRVRVAYWPVTTVYRSPMERVLFAEGRDANPFFHLAEAMWMLWGQNNDARFLDTFVKYFSSRFAESGGNQHGAYGFRWRSWFGEDQPFGIDQLELAIGLLKKNPDDRRVVLSMWDPAADLGQDYKDIPCNTHVYFRVLGGHRLDMTVMCRSNDIVWGAYGANAVHFAFLLEYVAAMSGYKPGVMYQVSNNYHIYETLLEKMRSLRSSDWAGGIRGSGLDRDLYTERRVKPDPLVGDPLTFDYDLDKVIRGEVIPDPSANPFLSGTVDRALQAAHVWRSGDGAKALSIAEQIKSPDWRLACTEWLGRHPRA